MMPVQLQKWKKDADQKITFKKKAVAAALEQQKQNDETCVRDQNTL